MLPVIAMLIDAHIVDIEGLQLSLNETQGRGPHVLDAETIDRIIRLYTDVQDEADLYTEQLRRWHETALTEAQAQEVERLGGEVVKLRNGAKHLVSVGHALRQALS